jgi:hypothetical protein
MNDKWARWSYNGANALVEYLEELETDMGDEIEFDVVALRGDFLESDSLQEWAKDYFRNDWKKEIGVEENTLDEEKDEQIRNFIHDRGILIEFDGGIIVSSF